MKFFTNKSIWSKIVIVLVMILLLQFCLSRPVHAEDEGVGGKLLSPIVELVLALLDGIVDLLHSSVMGQSESLIRIDMSDSFWQKALTFLVGIVAGIVAAVVIIGTGGLAAVAGTVAAVGAGISIVVKSAAIGLVAAVMFENTFYPDDMYLPIYTYSPEEIFKGNILLFDVDFFNPETEIYMKTNNDNNYKLSDYKESEEELAKKAQEEGGIKYYFYKNGDKEIVTSKQNTAYDLQNTISKWYVSIRNIVLVLMMSVLLYIGIRMLLSSVSSEKAKYKQMLIDWVVSICLIFFMHYIMAFSVTIVKNLTLSISAIDENSNDSEIYSVSLQDDKEHKLTDKVKDLYGEEVAEEEFISEQEVVNSEGETETSDVVTWPTNLMGKLRLQAQMSNGDVSFIGYAICFAMLVFYTVFFTFTYLKRVVYLAFLTIIAPFVALTYPIDKISDGSAQGFNKWIKEYVFNLLIQPLHLILYTVLISSAFELSSTNIIYSIVAIGFLIPAEKVMRSLFGFEKASTAGSLAGAAIGGSLINQGLNKLLHKGQSGGKKGDNGGSGGSSPDEGDSKINFQDDKFDAYQTLGDGANSEEVAETDQQQMLDAYDDGFGTEDWDPQERDAMAREAYKDSGGGMDYSADEYAQILRDSGYEEDDIKNMLAKDSRYSDNTSQNEEIPVQPTSNKVDSRPVRAIKGVGRVGMLGARKLYDNKGKIAKKAIKMTAAAAVTGAATAATAVAAGTIGIAAGAATGDFDNAVKYGLGAAGAGGLAGLNMSTSGINSIGSAIKTVKDSENIQRAYYGDRFEEHRTQKNISEWKKKNKGELEKEYGAKKASQMMKDGTIDQYLNANISSTEDIIALQKLQDDKVIKNFDQARAVHKLAKMTGDTTKMKAKDKKDWQATMKEKYIEKNYSEQQAQNASNESMRLVNEYYKNRK